MDDPVLERYFDAHSGATVNCLSAASNGKQIATAGSDSVVKVWSLKQNPRSYVYQGHKGDVTCVDFAPNCGKIATCSTDTTIRLWTPALKGDCRVFRAHTNTVRCVQFSIWSDVLASCSDDKSIKLWQIANQKFIFSLMGHRNWVRCVRFCPEAKLVASCGDDQTVRVWDTNSHTCIHSFSGHEALVSSLDYHPSGHYVASCSKDGSIRVWDLRMRRLGQIYTEHTSPVNSCYIHRSSGGRFLVSGSDDKTVKIFDLVEGRILFTLYGHQAAVTSTQFSEMSDQIYSSDANGQVFIWKSNVTSTKAHPAPQLKDWATETNAIDETDTGGIERRKREERAGTRSIHTLETGEPAFEVAHVMPVYKDTNNNDSKKIDANKRESSKRSPSLHSGAGTISSTKEPTSPSLTQTEELNSTKKAFTRPCWDNADSTVNIQGNDKFAKDRNSLSRTSSIQHPRSTSLGRRTTTAAQDSVHNIDDLYRAILPQLEKLTNTVRRLDERVSSMETKLDQLHALEMRRLGER